MKANLENWTLVIIGSWNSKIFNPRWVGEKLFGKNDLQIQILIPVIPGFPTVLSADNIEIIPAEESLTFRVKATTDAVLNELEEKAIRALQVLNHTPVRAIGVNFGFVEKQIPDSVNKLFSLSDKEALEEIGEKSDQEHVSHRLQMDNGVLNLALTKTLDELQVLLNFHLQLDYPKNLENADQALEFIKDKTIDFKNKAIEVLKSVYGLEFEEEQETE